MPPPSTPQVFVRDLTAQQDQAGPQQQQTPPHQGGSGGTDGSPHQQHATQSSPLFRDPQPPTTAATSGRWVYTFKPSCFVPHQHFDCSILLRRDNLRWEADVVQRNVAEPATTKVRAAGAHSNLVTGRANLFEKRVLDYFHLQGMVVEYGKGLDKAALSKMPNDELIAMLYGCVDQCKLRLEAGDTERCILAQVCLPVPPKLQALLQLPGDANVTLRFSNCFPDFIAVTRCSSGQVSLRVTDTKSSQKRKRCHELQIAFYVACLQEWFEGNTTVTIDSGHGEVWLPQRTAATTTEAPYRVDVFKLPSRTTQGIEDFVSRDLASALEGVPAVPDGRDVALIGIEDAWLAKRASCENCSQLHACKSAAATGHVLAACGEARLLEAWPQRCRSFSDAQSARPSDGVLRGIVRKDFSAKHAKAVDLVYLRKAAPKTVFVVLSRGNPSNQPSGLQEENSSQTDVRAITFVASDDPQPILFHEGAQSLMKKLTRYRKQEPEMSLVCWDVAQRRLLRQVMLGSGADGQSLAAAIFEDFSLMYTVDDAPRALESCSICATVKEPFEALLDLSEPLPLLFGDVLRMEVVGSDSAAQPSENHPLTTNDLFAPFYTNPTTAVGPATVAMTRLSQQWSSFLKVAEDSRFVLEPPQTAAYDDDDDDVTTLECYFTRKTTSLALIRFLRRMTTFTACSDLEECVQGLQHPVQLSASKAAKMGTETTWCMELAWPERDQERLSVSDPADGTLLGTYRYFEDLAGVKSVTDISNKYKIPVGSGRCDVILTESQPAGTVVGIKAASNKATKPPLLLTKRFMDFNTSKVVAALDASLEDNTPILSMILSEDPDIESDVEGERTSINKWVESQHARGRVAPSEDQVPVLKQFMRFPLTLLWGPPGTGKTTTISHLLKYVAEHGLPELKRKPRILITATTKDALHAIMGSLWKFFGKKHDENVKGAPEDTIATKLLSNKGILGDHLPTVLYIDSADMVSPTVGSKAHRALGEDGVIVLTTPWQAHKFLSEKLEKMFKPFDALIVDEASQMPVAHALVASRLLNLKKHRILCAGDLLQLPPILPEGIASSLSQFMKTHARTPRSDLLLSCSGSILQALMRGTDKSRLVDPSSFGSGAQQPKWLNLVQLKVSRRSVPRIVEFVGHIYPAQLRHGGPDADSADGQLLGPLGPGTHELALHETSHEANSIVQLIVALRDRRAQSNAATKEVTIHVVTSHRRQRHAIQAALEKEIPGLKEAGKLSIAVSTTEKSQGLEADIVVLAMADGISYASPFPFNLFRLNVAISRAKHQVVVIVKSRAQMLEAAESVAAADGCPPASVKGAQLLQRLVGLTTTW